ncbi:hypothetical protein TUM4445_08250 [Shewanella sp. MBTL60-112-B2]|nr:hypothetical protein TUM4444_36490 [Shewanella sp. MBTL60-112-B1]GIU27787.1 hypothetical protein TUM4445_08250 [Shewanella sp. MBTL60-112-B2]
MILPVDNMSQDLGLCHVCWFGKAFFATSITLSKVFVYTLLINSLLIMLDLVIKYHEKAESRKQKAESRKQKAESRKQKAESRKQKAESRLSE